MTRDDIVKWAAETGLGSTRYISESQWRSLHAFAELAAAYEREAIARMIEDSPPLVSFAQNEMGGCVMCGFTPKLAALTIRERGAP